jgi:hydrogenase-4 component B
MPVRGSSFGAQMDMFFRPLFTFRSAITRQADKFVAALNGIIHGAGKAETFSDRYIIDSIAAFVSWLSPKMQRILGGNFRVYLLYIVVALVVLLVMAIFL